VVGKTFEVSATIEAALKSDMPDTVKSLILEAAKDYDVTIKAALEDGVLTADEKLLITAKSADVTKKLLASGGSLTDDQKTLLNALSGDTKAVIDASITTSGTVSIGDKAETALEDLGDTVESEQLKVAGIIDLNQGISNLTDAINSLVMGQTKSDYDNYLAAIGAEAGSASVQSSINSISIDQLAASVRWSGAANSALEAYKAGNTSLGDTWADEASAWRGIYSTYTDTLKDLEITKAGYDLVASKKDESKSGYETYLASRMALLGYSQGGYTGNGGKYEPAGIVHKGEYVLSQDMLAQLGGKSAVANLEALRLGYQPFNGYVNGGMVGNVISTSSGFNNGGIVLKLDSLISEVKMLRDQERHIGTTLIRNTADTADYLEEMVVS
jgi:hypothetical protein